MFWWRMTISVRMSGFMIRRSICHLEGEGPAAQWERERQLYLEINAPVFNYTNIARYARWVKCNYLVVKIPNEQQKAELERYGYT